MILPTGDEKTSMTTNTAIIVQMRSNILSDVTSIEANMDPTRDEQHMDLTRDEQHMDPTRNEQHMDPTRRQQSEQSL